jgi:D-amino-acid oxidase
VPDGVRDLAERAGSGRLVVNCTGLGARTLCDDDRVYPLRGQVVRVRNPGLTRCLADDVGPRALSYVVPRRRDVVLGGTADAHAWDRTPDPAVTQRILARCAELEPRLRDADVLDVNVGLRPARDEVRLETERVGTGVVIHNYGHGGAGFTLAWGCADEVLALARDAQA